LCIAIIWLRIFVDAKRLKKKFTFGV